MRERGGARGEVLYVGLGAGAAPAFAKLKYPACEVEAVELIPSSWRRRGNV